MNDETPQDLEAPQRWGLSEEAIADLGDRLQRCWERYRHCFKTTTRDVARHAWTYLKGLLLMNTKRNFANIDRRVRDPKGDGQNLQQFMSDSPWEAQPVIAQVQAEITQTPGLAPGGVLLLDESADEKAGDKSAGAGRQHNGRLGKVEMSQVGVFLAYYRAPVWTWVDGELYLPQHWFTPEMAAERQRVGVPAKREFATKIELGWRMLQRATVPFEAVAMDDLYGRSGWLRHQMNQAGMLYMAEIPEDTQVYLTQPDFGLPPADPDKPGRPCTRPQVLSAEKPVAVRQIATHPDTHWQRFQARNTERGILDDAFALRQVWTIRDAELAEEWLVIRHEYGKRYTYALSNAPAATAHDRLAGLKCVRHFVERANQDAKSEAGWDEFQAQKYRAWEHQLALTILATWFIAQTKYEWAQAHPPDPQLAQQMELEGLPSLSVANVRELLQAVMPLPQLSQEQATRLVVKHLVKRSRSTRCRLKAQHDQRTQA